MYFASSLREKCYSLKNNLKGDSLDKLIWLINVAPKLSGFPLLQKRVHPLFWIIHFFVLFYIYGVGVVLFLIFDVQGTADFSTKCRIDNYNVNLSILIIVCNISYWFLTKRSQVKSILITVKNNDELVSKNLKNKRQNLLTSIMRILLLFYGFNILEDIFIYLPNKTNITHTFCMTPCPGLQSFTQSPDREICIVMLWAGELTFFIVGMNYEALLYLLVAHTAVMYEILADEINQLNEIDEEGNKTENSATAVAEREALVKERLRSFIIRHCLILETIQKMKNLYSFPIGVNFLLSAICIVTYFFLPSEDYVAFSPVLVYCIMILFLYCFLCQMLINASEKFERAVYSCGWENFQITEKQIIYNMLVSAQRPVKLLAAYIVPVNIATFASTCQSIYKFVTVMKMSW